MEFWQLAGSWSPVCEFEPLPLPRALVERCLEAAHAAPAPPGPPPWRFTVLVDAAQRSALVAALVAASPAEARTLASACAQAPVLVAVHAASSEAAISFGVGACIQNLLLCAWDEGAGALPLAGPHWGTPAVRAACGIDGEGALAAVVALGYPAAVPPRRPRVPAADCTRWLAPPPDMHPPDPA